MVLMATDDEIREAIATAPNMRQAAAMTDIHYLTFRKRAEALGIWQPRQGGVSGKCRNAYTKIPLNEILTGTHYGYAGNLKQRLLEEGIKKNECEACGLHGEWQGKSLTIELDHINGDSGDHRLENLRMLCPNCHSQTPTFRARNIRRGYHHHDRLRARGSS